MIRKNSRIGIINNPKFNLVLIFCLFFILVCIYTYPLINDLGKYYRGPNDPLLFTWILSTVRENFFSNPLHFFESNIFYPHGYTLTYSEPLIIPALIFSTVIYKITPNPIFCYNLTLLVCQTLCGVAAYYATKKITHSTAGSIMAGAIYSISPFKTGYYNFINLHMQFAVPLGILFLLKYLEKYNDRYYYQALFFLLIQAITIWYAGIPLAFFMCLLVICFFLLRPIGWKQYNIKAIIIGGGLFVGAILFFVLPYLMTSMEMGFERSLKDVNHFRADFLSFFDAGRDHLFYNLIDSKRFPGLFAGFVAYALSTLALGLSIHRCRSVMTPRYRFLWLSLFLLNFLGIGYILLFIFSRTPAIQLFNLQLKIKYIQHAVFIILGSSIFALALLGMAWRKGKNRGRQLSPKELGIVFSFLAFVSMLLTLGPTMHMNNIPIGEGIYTLAYNFFPGFKSIRISLRLNFMFLFFIGLLSSLGLKYLENTSAHKKTKLIVYTLPLIVLIEFLPGNLSYQKIDYTNPPEVYRWLKNQDGDFAILEYPTKNESIDSTYVFWSLYHKKKLVNGVSGFYPKVASDIAYGVKAIPESKNISKVQEVYNLRYVMIHMNYLNPMERNEWQNLLDNPPKGLRLRKKFNNEIVFEIDSKPIDRWNFNLLFNRYTLSNEKTLKLDIKPGIIQDGIINSIEIVFNKKLIETIQLKPWLQTYTINLPPPYLSKQPNKIALKQFYHINKDTRNNEPYRVGRSGVYSNSDIVVISSDTATRQNAQIWVNGREFTRNQRGFNFAVISRDGARLLQQQAFNPARAKEDFDRMVQFINQIPNGMIVTVALRKSDLIDVTDDILNIFKKVGSSGIMPKDNQGMCYTLIGIKGLKGSAIESFDDHNARIIIGQDRRRQSMTIHDYSFI